MTDKELAKKYVKEEKYVARYDMEQTELDEIVEETYIAGIKAGRPQWHNLRKNPTDLPEPYMSVVNQNGRNVLYDYIHRVWRFDDANEYICDTPIAWCEIPTYTEDA